MLFYTVLVAIQILSARTEANETVPMCMWKNRRIPEHAFQKVTCAMCYRYMHPINFLPGRKALLVGQEHLLVGNVTVEANATNPDRLLIDTFVSVPAINKWSQCCLKAAECCRQMIDTNNAETDKGWCPLTWDGWQCWNTTPPTSIQETECPAHIRFGTSEHKCQLTVKKKCLQSGQWEGHPKNQSREWTDYSSCSIHYIIERRLYIGIIAYAISAAFLLPALVIFYYYRQLSGYRIVMHKNLFISLLLNAVFQIWLKTSVLLNIFHDNGLGNISKQHNILNCIVLTLLNKYFRLTNYMWMFCEGFYLHHLISSAFSEDKKLIKFYIIGWGFPVIQITVYSLLRIFSSDDDCWALPTESLEWVLNVPCLISLLANAVFLVDIVRILVNSLRAPQHYESAQYRKTLRAIIVLVPVFGLHYAVTVYRPQFGTCQWPEFYVYLDILLDGLQGAAVALIFCFINGEVHTLLRRSYQNFIDLRHPSIRSAGSRLPLEQHGQHCSDKNILFANIL